MLKYELLKDHLNGEFNKLFHYDATDYFLSPGRLEIIGNHTDHNHGFAIVSSASIYIKSAASKNDKNRIVLFSKGFEKVVDVEIKKYEPNSKVYSTTYALICGIVTGFLNRNYKVSGVDIYCESDILSGSGISSSAAFELLICTILNEMYNDGKIDKLTLVHISQESERNFFGKPCGLLDQIGCAFGGISMVDFNDPSNPVVTNISFPFDDLAIVLTNPGGSHSGLDSYYASITQDMAVVAKACGKLFLRDVDLDVYKSIALNNTLTEQQINRAKHFFNECNRVCSAYNSIKNKDEYLFIKMINESGLSSSNLLNNTLVPGRYENSPEKALTIARKVTPQSGHRVHGGGFMGTIISFCKEEDKAVLINEMKKEFGDNSIIETSISPFGSTKI